MTAVQRVELRYGDGPRNLLDLYYCAPSTLGHAPPLIVYVPGGAWRSGDKSQYTALSEKLAEASCAVAVINYTISPRKPEDGPAVHHPKHAQDVLDALEFLRSRNDQEAFANIPLDAYDASRMYPIGHSAGAHILSCLFLQSPDPFRVSSELAISVKGVIVAEGIYDVDLLLRAHPDYRDFIQGAFGIRNSYADVSPTTYPARDQSKHLQWLVVQSSGDVLIKEDQSNAAYDTLSQKFPPEQVHKDFDSVTEGHFELLQTPQFRRLILRFVETVEGHGEDNS
ncbi:Kynurenine formamidase [Tulasnella sp. 403]|nr:Kynurenine formamidase [Tulasnella sp. 403]